jgi:hypothetical protein
MRSRWPIEWSSQTCWAMPSVVGHQGLLQQRWQLRPGRAAGIQQVLFGRSGLAQRLLHLGLVELGLSLGQPPQGIGIGAKQPQRGRLLGADRDQLLEELDDQGVVCADVVGGGWWSEAEGVMQPLYPRQVDALLGAELLVRARQPRLGGHGGHVHEGERQLPPCDEVTIASTDSPAACHALRNRSRAASWIPNPPAGSWFFSAPA